MRFPFEILAFLASAILAAVLGLWPVTGAALLIALVLGLYHVGQVGVLAAPRAAPPPRAAPRLRLFLRLHPGRGHATVFELWRHWSAARLRAERQVCPAMTMTIDRPQLTMRDRIKNPDHHSVMLGRAQLGFPVRLPCEEHAVMIAPPRTYKSALLAKIILRYQGPVLSTTTRADLYRNTDRARRKLGGTVHTFNPQGIGGVPSTFALDVIGGTPEDRGCLDIATAIRRADAFAYAGQLAGHGRRRVLGQQDQRIPPGVLLRCRLRPVAGRITSGWPTVARWALTDRSEQAEDILKDAGAGHWSEELRQLRGQAQKTAETIRMYLSQALQFMADPPWRQRSARGQAKLRSTCKASRPATTRFT